MIRGIFQLIEKKISAQRKRNTDGGIEWNMREMELKRTCVCSNMFEFDNIYSEEQKEEN